MWTTTTTSLSLKILGSAMNPQQTSWSRSHMQEEEHQRNKAFSVTHGKRMCFKNKTSAFMPSIHIL